MLLLTDQPKLVVDHLEASNEVKPGKGNLSETMEHPETKAIKTDTNSKTKNEKYLADSSQKAVSSNRDTMKRPTSVNIASLKNGSSSQPRKINFNQSKPAGQEEHRALLSRCKYFFFVFKSHPFIFVTSFYITTDVIQGKPTHKPTHYSFLGKDNRL